MCLLRLSQRAAVPCTASRSIVLVQQLKLTPFQPAVYVSDSHNPHFNLAFEDWSVLQLRRRRSFANPTRIGSSARRILELSHFTCIETRRASSLEGIRSVLGSAETLRPSLMVELVAESMEGNRFEQVERARDSFRATEKRRGNSLPCEFAGAVEGRARR